MYQEERRKRRFPNHTFRKRRFPVCGEELPPWTLLHQPGPGPNPHSFEHDILLSSPPLFSTPLLLLVRHALLLNRQELFLARRRPLEIRSQYVQQLSALAPGHDNRKPPRHPKIGPPHDAAGSRLRHNFAAIARVDLAMRIDGWWLGGVVPAWACSCACKLRRLEFPEGQRSLPSDSLPSLSCAWLRGLCCVVLRCVALFMCVCLSLCSLYR